MKVRRYDRQLRDPDLRWLYRRVICATFDDIIERLGGRTSGQKTMVDEFASEPPWWLARRLRRR